VSLVICTAATPCRRVWLGRRAVPHLQRRLHPHLVPVQLGALGRRGGRGPILIGHLLQRLHLQREPPPPWWWWWWWWWWRQGVCALVAMVRGVWWRCVCRWRWCGACALVVMVRGVWWRCVCRWGPCALLGMVRGGWSGSGWVRGRLGATPSNARLSAALRAHAHLPRRPRVCLQGNQADVFGNDVYMESWVATPAYFNPYPTAAREPRRRCRLLACFACFGREAMRPACSTARRAAGFMAGRPGVPACCGCQGGGRGRSAARRCGLPCCFGHPWA
jgi:hypothetical protein